LEALLRVFDEEIQLVAAPETLTELERVMQYDRLPFTDSERKQFLQILRHEAELVNDSPTVEVIEQDPDDDIFLACAVGGTCQYVVSGDEHLLAVGSFRGVEIVTPAAFLDHTDDA